MAVEKYDCQIYWTKDQRETIGSPRGDRAKPSQWLADGPWSQRRSCSRITDVIKLISSSSKVGARLISRLIFIKMPGIDIQVVEPETGIGFLVFLFLESGSI
jgi:hypothetical protein